MLQGVQAKNQRERPGGAEVVSLGEASGRVACRRLSKIRLGRQNKTGIAGRR